MDNSGALNLAHNAESLGRSRHIARRANFLQMATSQNAVRGQWLSTVHMLADLLTKPLDRKRFVMLRDRIMGASPAAPHSGGSSEPAASSGESSGAP